VGVAKDMGISLLYDFYGELLTEKQRETVELYYNEDLSLAEIAAHSGITRQGVRDSIKRAEYQLLEYEQLLGLAGRFSEIRKTLTEITEAAQTISRMNDRLYGSKDIASQAARIADLARQLEG
jgi:predicted DNA-binding protein YlxM (UPF0122 family)